MSDERTAQRRRIEAVLESFANAPPPDVAPEDEAIVAQLRSAFLAAGAARLERAFADDRWLQAGVACASERAADAFLGGPLRAQLAAWRAAGKVEQFFFMRKPPGLRLRFAGAGVEARLGGELRAFLDGAVARGEVLGHAPATYEPESHQFGGEEGMRIAHAFFDADTTAFLELLARGEDGSSGREYLSLSLLNHLIRKVTLDRWEQWDVWCRMVSTGRARPPGEKRRAVLLAELASNRDALLTTLEGALASDLPETDRAILEPAFAANERLAHALAQAGPRLLYGPRKLLPFWIVFHWNRWAFDEATQSALVFFMQTLLDPKGEP